LDPRLGHMACFRQWDIGKVDQCLFSWPVTLEAIMYGDIWLN
jgi:hypothetical protein